MSDESTLTVTHEKDAVNYVYIGSEFHLWALDKAAKAMLKPLSATTEVETIRACLRTSPVVRITENDDDDVNGVSIEVANGTMFDGMVHAAMFIMQEARNED